MSQPGRPAVDAELGDILWGGVDPPVDKPIAFSPFGLGVLDIGLANQLLLKAIADGTTTPVAHFYDPEN
jgi:ornithine cyclodeaminase